jgi:hypothetical protein
MYLWWRYETGTQHCPLSSQKNHLCLDYANSQWLNEVYRFTKQYNIQVHTKIDGPSALREHDKFITDLAHEQGLSLKTLRYINKCQMYLQAITIADITNEIGTTIEIQFYVWKEALPKKTNIATSPILPRPNKATWTYWKQFLDQYVLPNS